MLYEYLGLNCPNQCNTRSSVATTPDAASPDGKRAVCHHLVQLPMSKCQDLGATRKCPIKGCKGRVTRVMSSGISFIIRGNSAINMDTGQSYMSKVNGKEVKFTFVDHKNTMPGATRDLSGLTGASPGMGNAYYSEKHGQMVVDVASNVPDPLGTLKRATNASDDKLLIKRNTPYRIRPGAKKNVGNWRNFVRPGKGGSR